MEELGPDSERDDAGPSYDYVGPVNASLECAICRQPFDNPAMAPTCQHIFCTICILRALELSPTCPIDRSPLSLDVLAEAPRIIQQMVQELPVFCPNKDRGCPVQCERGLLAGHLKGACGGRARRERSPSVKGKERAVEGEVEVCELCREDVPVTALKSHPAECVSAPTTCLHCDTSLPRHLLPSHFLECPSIPIPCPHASHGCRHRLPRSLMVEEHLEVSCAFEPLKDLLTQYDTRLDTAASENALLRRRCDALEDGMREMRDVLDGVKRGMGDFWVQPPPSRGSMVVQMGAGLVAAGAQERDAAPSSTAAARSSSLPGHILYATPPSPPITIPTSTLSTWIDPPFSFEAAPTPNFPTLDPLPPSSPPLSQSTPLSLAPPHPTPSPTLPAVLSSLSHSVQSLSTSLTALDARQQSALMNETLRIQDETLRTQDDVQALRAGLHGVRLQMHYVLMELARVQGMGLGLGLGMGGGGVGGGGRQESGGGTSDGAESNSDEEGGVGGGGRLRWFSGQQPPMPPAMYGGFARGGPGMGGNGAPFGGVGGMKL